MWGVTSHTHRRQSKAVGQRGPAGETIAAWGGRSDAAREQDAHAARGMQDGRQNLNSHILGTRVHSRRLASRLSRACFTSLFTTSELSEAAPMRISTATFFLEIWSRGKIIVAGSRTAHTPHATPAKNGPAPPRCTHPRSRPQTSLSSDQDHEDWQNNARMGGRISSGQRADKYSSGPG